MAQSSLRMLTPQVIVYGIFILLKGHSQMSQIPIQLFNRKSEANIAKTLNLTHRIDIGVWSLGLIRIVKWVIGCVYFNCFYITVLDGQIV